MIVARRGEPAISVAVAAYNVQKWISECIDSLLAQSFKEFEIVVVDDCSTDRTCDILEKYAELDARIRVIKHTQNMGLVAARSTALKMCRGKYVWFIDGDDYVDIGALKKLYAVAERDQCDIVRAKCKFDILGEIKKVGWQVWTDVRNTTLRDFHDLHHAPHWLVLNLFRKSFLDNLSFSHVPAGINLGEDMVLNSLAFAKAQRITMLDSSVYFYRRHGESYTMNSHASKRLYLQEAIAHSLVHGHWSDFKRAQMDFMISGSAHRLRCIRDACLHTKPETAIEVIKLYKMLYRDFEPGIAVEIVNASNHSARWSKSNFDKLFCFVEMMHSQPADLIFSKFRFQSFNI